MCGIAGYFAHRDAADPPREAQLFAMRDAMRRRGPDGAGLWVAPDRRVGLAHRRLSIIDPSDAGAQPMLGADGRHVIIFNGEIYNYAALMDELRAEGHVFRGHSDTEVLLHLYDRDGLGMFDRLRGMYAIAIWDVAARRLVLARDPYGIKPLYVSDADGCIRFASQVKALLADPAVSKQVDPAGLVGFHLFGSVPEPFTLYRSIRALPPGHHVTIDARGVGEPVEFASITRRIATAIPERFDPEAVIEAVRDSIAAHLVSDVPVGAFLSGGVDSGAVVGVATDLASAPQTVTLSFPEFAGHEYDEVALAARVAAQYGAPHHIRSVTASEFRADLPAIFEAMDQPSLDGINSWFAAKAMHELGIKVALSGLGGDELMAGYSTFQTVPATHRWFGLPSRVPGIGAGARALLRTFAPRLLDHNPKLAGLLDLPASLGGSYLLRRAVLLPFELDVHLDEEVAREGLARLAPVHLADRALDPMPAGDVGRVAALEANFYLRNQLLRDSDWAGMAHSLEIRVPLVDYTLLGRVAPMIDAIRPGDGKAALASAPSTPLPPAVLHKPKTGFSIPLISWLDGRDRHIADRRDSRRWQQHVIQRFVPDDRPGKAA